MTTSNQVGEVCTQTVVVDDGTGGVVMTRGQIGCGAGGGLLDGFEGGDILDEGACHQLVGVVGTSFEIDLECLGEEGIGFALDEFGESSLVASGELGIVDGPGEDELGGVGEREELKLSLAFGVLKAHALG